MTPDALTETRCLFFFNGTKPNLIRIDFLTFRGPEWASSGSRLQQPTKRMKREIYLDLSEEEEDVNNLQMPQLIEHDVGFLDELMLPNRR